MADFFGQAFWPVRYFPAGYWGFSGDVPDGAMSAHLSGTSWVTAELAAQAGGSSSFVPLAGWRFRRTIPRVSVRVAINATVTAELRAQLRGAAKVDAGLAGIGLIGADLTGAGSVSAIPRAVFGDVAARNAFWLLAA